MHVRLCMCYEEETTPKNCNLSNTPSIIIMVLSSSSWETTTKNCNFNDAHLATLLIVLMAARKQHTKNCNDERPRRPNKQRIIETTPKNCNIKNQGKTRGRIASRTGEEETIPKNCNFEDECRKDCEEFVHEVTKNNPKEL